MTQTSNDAKMLGLNKLAYSKVNLMTKKPSLSYRDAGVDIDAGNSLVEQIKPLVKATHRKGVMGNIGGFGGFFELPKGYTNPVLVSGTDGVGTKLRLALETGIHDTIGIDLVAMCVNDIIVTGAEPLYFLDYYATGKLDIDVAKQVIKGITVGCQQSGIALIGGETAEMPGMYSESDYDLAGFSVGIIEKSSIIDGSAVQEGDILLGLASSGPHSNGYSLIRNVIKHVNADLSAKLDNEQTLAQALMQPTQIYVKPLLEIANKTNIHAMAHITGGGLLENIPRVLPENLAADININSWKMPAVFHWLQENGNIQNEEMYRTFNCGIGMILALPESAIAEAQQILNDHSIGHHVIGKIVKRDADNAQVLI